MDHNLGDSLNLDNSMGVDFEHPEDAVVGETDITLDDSGHDQGIPMEFEHIEEQPILMDTGGEEIIDFIGEQFTLQEYAEHEDQTDILTASMDSDAHNILTSQSDTVVEIEASPHVTTKKQDHTLPKMVTVKTPFSPPRANEGKKNETAVHSSAPRQVPIAPKPPTIPHGSKSYMQGKQFAIAPKPIALLTGQNNSFLKKVTLTGVMQGNKGNPVLTQIGKQLLMMPTTGPQKLKLLTTGTVMPTVQYIRTSTGEQAQMMQTKNVAATHNKPVITKLLLPGQQNMEVNNPQTILTKVTPVSSAKQTTAQFVTMQPKTVPLTLGNKVLLATPTKSGVKFAKKQQIISFKSPEKVSQTAQGPATKKVLITSNPSQNVILKTTAPPKAQITKDGNIIVEGQRTQLHQINVPGKGIQYIRLVTNSNPVPVKPKLQPQTINIPAKTFLLTDTKGNLIQMAAEKPSNSGQPPPMVILGNNSSTLNQMSTSKPQQKLVRIAPLVTKAGQSLSINRSSQSLLAPLSPMSEVPQSAKDFASDAHDRTNSKSSLSALVADALRGEGTSEEQSDILNEINVRNKMHGSNDTITEVEVEFKRDSYSDCEDNNDNMDRHDESSRSEKHPLIVIPSNFMKETDGMNTSDSQSGNDDPQKMNNILNMDNTDLLNIYQSPRTPQALSDSDIVPTELGLRPRKACNCTKSQCLKLYCECFANGEFCNRCNCTNCHNNLDNEERRQKAIRGCLDRNPNAFRPKIGKAKVGGPENVRRHNKGCNCKRSGCLKNYCECYEAKIACTSICKCVGCRNVEETMERARRRTPYVSSGHALYRPPPLLPLKQPCSFITSEVIEAVCQCLLAAGSESVGGGDGGGAEADNDADPVRDVIDEFARCLQDIISASHQSSPLALLEDV